MLLKLSLRWALKLLFLALFLTIVASLAFLSSATIAALDAALRNCNLKVLLDKRNLIRA
jgi:hypothetical protein